MRRCWSTLAIGAAPLRTGTVARVVTSGKGVCGQPLPPASPVLGSGWPWWHTFESTGLLSFGGWPSGGPARGYKSHRVALRKRLGQHLLKNADVVRVACGVWRVVCGVWRAACGMRHVARVGGGRGVVPAGAESL